MSVWGTVFGVMQRGWCWASFFGAVLGLSGCGGSTSDPHSGPPQNTGGSLQTGGRNGGSNAGGLAGSLAGSDAESQAGRAGAQEGLGGSSAAAGTSGSEAGGDTAVDPALAHLPLPAGCKPLSGEETTLLCSLHTTCGAVTAQNSCYHTGSGGWQCTCEAPNADRTYLVNGAIGLDACAVAAGLCSGPAPALDLESCLPTHEVLGGEEGAKTCALDMNCQTPAPVDFAPGVFATLYGGGSVKCKELPAPDQTTGPLRIDCEASGKSGAKPYSVVANALADACLPVLKAFLAPPDPEFAGYDSCTREATSTAPNDCLLTETCYDSAPLAPGVNVVRNPLSRGVFCAFDDAGSLNCGCRWDTASGDPAAPHRDVFTFDLGPASKPARCDFSRCPLDVHAQPTGSGECSSGDAMDDGDSCQGFFTCERPATLDGKAVTVYSQLDTRCAEAADHSVYCACVVGDQTASFRMNDGTSLADACTFQHSACLQHVELPVGRASYASSPPNPLPAP